MSANLEARDTHWLVNNFVDGIPGVANAALVVTTDGLVLAHSSLIARGSADQLAAVTSGLASLTAGAARFLDGRSVRQVIVEMESGYLFVTGRPYLPCLRDESNEWVRRSAGGARLRPHAGPHPVRRP